MPSIRIYFPYDETDQNSRNPAVQPIEIFYESTELTEKTPIIIAIHGNSGSVSSFVMQKSLKNAIFIDLPGHGKSSEPQHDELGEEYARKIYSFEGYALIVKLFIESMHFSVDQKIIILGWSLGGQIAYSMMDRYPDSIHGVIVWGAPPVPKGNLMAGFIPFPECAMMGQLTMFTREESIVFNRAAGLPNKKAFVNDCMICDGRSRAYMIEAANKESSTDAKSLMAKTTIPIIILIGDKDQGVNKNYIMNDVVYNSLIYMTIVPNANHALHYSHPAIIKSAIDVMMGELRSPTTP